MLIANLLPQLLGRSRILDLSRLSRTWCKAESATRDGAEYEEAPWLGETMIGYSHCVLEKCFDLGPRYFA